MDLRFTADEQAFRQRIRDWTAANLPADIKAKVDKGIELERDDFQRWMKILSGEGWIAPNWDTKDGGPGFSLAEKYIFEEELFGGNAPRTVHFGTRMVGPVLLAFGTPEQKKRYLPKILTSEEIWCQGYSEPGSGSDLASLKTSAVRTQDDEHGDHYVVNGTKIWTSYAHCADRMFALVRTDNTGKKQEGITCLLIDLKAPGVSIQPIITLDGRHVFNQEFFDDVRVPVEDRIGEEGQGWSIAKYLLGHERSNASYVSINKRNLSKLKAIAADQMMDGAPLAESEAFKQLIAEAEVSLETLSITSLRQLATASADKPVGPEASVLKMRTGDVFQRIHELMMMAGGYSMAPFVPEAIRDGWNEDPVGPDYLFRMAPDYFEARAMSIAGGSHEVQKNIIAKAVLGL